MSSIHLSHGIVNGSGTISVSTKAKFSGADHSQVTDLMRNVESALHAKGIDMPPESISHDDWLKVNQLGFTTKANERTTLNLAQITQEHTEMGYYKVGDYNLTFHNRQRFDEAVKKATSTKLQAAAIFMEQIEKGSEAEILLQPAYTKGNFIQMRTLLYQNYRPKTLSVIYANEYKNLVNNIANALKDKP
jgi:hypothetical protein